jgi:hypothetical protein
MVTSVRWIATSSLLLLGACDPFYVTSVSGTVTLDAGLDDEHDGSAIGLLFLSSRIADGPADCEPMWGECPPIGLEYPLYGADGEPAIVRLGATVYAFWNEIPYSVGVDYTAEVGAYLDVDTDGVYDAGEPVGWFAANPVSRATETMCPGTDGTACNLVTVTIAAP